jgi:hypothetical protein
VSHRSECLFPRDLFVGTFFAKNKLLNTILLNHVVDFLTYYHYSHFVDLFTLKTCSFDQFIGIIRFLNS